jgi:hypothetical protein
MTENEDQFAIVEVDGRKTFGYWSAAAGAWLIAEPEKPADPFAEFGRWFAQFAEDMIAAFRPLTDALRQIVVQLGPAAELLAKAEAKAKKTRWTYRRWNDPAAAADRMDWYRQQVEAQTWIRKTVRSRTVPRSS